MHAALVFIFSLFLNVSGIISCVTFFSPSTNAHQAPTDYPALFFGNKDAPIKVIEYSSVGCGLCSAFKKKDWPHVNKNYIENGRVQWSVHHYPLSHADLKAGMFSMCHHDSSVLFDRYFDQQGRWIFATDPLEEVRKIAIESGMSPEQVQQCESDEDLLNRFIELRLHANSTYELVGTPAFVIGKTVIPGYVSKEMWDKIIAQAEEYVQNGGELALFELDLPDEDDITDDQTDEP